MSSPPTPAQTINPNKEKEVRQLNDVTVSHNPHEFLLTLGQIFPVYDFTGKITEVHKLVIERLVISPAFAKILRDVLNTNISKYEDKFGDIATDVPPNLS